MSVLTERGKLYRTQSFHEVGNDKVNVPRVGSRYRSSASVFDSCRRTAAEETGPDNFSPDRFPEDKISVGMSELNDIFV